MAYPRTLFGQTLLFSKGITPEMRRVIAGDPVGVN